jgi:hypothetical protein
VQSEIEDLLHIAREDGGHERIPERDLGMAGQGRGLGDGVVADQRQHAAVLADARVVGVLEGIAGAIHARRLAVPHAEHAVVLGVGKEPRHLAAEHRGRCQVLVEARGEHDVVLLEQRAVAFERLVETPQGRPPVPGHEGRGVETTPPVRAMLIERQPDEGLDPGQIDVTVLLGVLGIQGEILGLGAHEIPFRWWSGLGDAPMVFANAPRSNCPDRVSYRLSSGRRYGQRRSTMIR